MMQTDVKASATIASNGSLTDASGVNVLGRTRIKAVYGLSGATAGYVVLYDGTSTADPILINIDTPASADQGTYWLQIPGEGILAQNGVYAEVSGVSSCLVIYG